MKIIIVDDNLKFLESMEIYITMRLGYKVIASFNSATSAINSSEIHKADIILMDIEMPEINGIEATKRALWNDKDLKIIAVTNHQEKAYLTSLISAGFKGCVYKNNVFDELNTAINTVIADQMYFPSGIPFQKKHRN